MFGTRNFGDLIIKIHKSFGAGRCRTVNIINPIHRGRPKQMGQSDKKK